MGRNYLEELLELKTTYQTVREPSPETSAAIRALNIRASTRPAVFVGSGGTLALAELAGLCSTWIGGLAPRSTTPLEVAALSAGAISRSEVVLFSARARHPDVRLAARAARAQPGNFVTLATQVATPEIQPDLRSVVDEVLVLPRTSKDGFLATNSVLAMATTWVAASGFSLPDNLGALDVPAPAWPPPATRALIVYGPSQRTVALDLEARLSETGMADVQLADYRNLAHGRHVGLLARADETAVVYLEDSAIEPLARRTQSSLPDSLMSIRLRTPHDGPVGALDLLASAMRLVGSISQHLDLNPGAPSVGSAGRRLYHLPWASLSAKPDGGRPSRLKGLEAGAHGGSGKDASAWTHAEKQWRGSIDGMEVTALVVDHDGTCVPTQRRTEPPAIELQQQVLRLVEAGVRLGFASGRGPSLLTELRHWIPPSLWPEVTVGIYNGATVTTLDQDVERSVKLDDVFAEAVTRLRRGLVGEDWKIECRTQQLTIERQGLSGKHTATAIRSVLGQLPELDLKVFASGHSVDVIKAGTTKRNVVDAVCSGEAEVMLVGDQGQHLGNDFELLSSRTLSMSVDRVSADSTRCWNLSTDGTRGPELLMRYLKALELSGSVVRVRAHQLGKAP